MHSVSVKDLMVSLEEYAVVSYNATLYEAVLALEKAQKELDKTRYAYLHRAILVYDDNKKIIGKIDQLDILRALDPKYGEMGESRSMSRAGFSPGFLKNMLEQYSILAEPILEVCRKAADVKVSKIMYTPSEGEYVDEKATIREAIHQFVMGHHQSLLVTGDDAIVGVAIFIIVGFVIPTPKSVIEVVDKFGFADKMIGWKVAHDVASAARKIMIVLGIIPMAIIFFATEAIPIGLTGILMPTLAYFFHILPRDEIGKTFAGDAPMFLLGVLAMGVAVVDVGLHKRLASWLLGWTKGFLVPVFVLCISMSVLGSFISAHAMCAFMTPVMVTVYFGAVASGSRDGTMQHDPALAKFLLFTPCYALNVEGVGSPAAGGRNVIMMGIRDETKRMGEMSYPEYIIS